MATLGALHLVPNHSAPVDYSRADYDGAGWSDADGDCVSTRHEVLAAESLEPVVWSANGCSVETGLWIDAWSGEAITSASEATLDHVVALSHAHEAGAWAWDADTKQRFANDTDPETLNVVSAETNSAKGAEGPTTWQPESPAAFCAFAHAWVETKARWGLSVTFAESAALEDMLQTCPSAASSGPRSEQPIETSIQPLVPTIGLATATPAPTATSAPTATVLPTASPTTAPPPECHPSYSPCLLIVSDYDCAGGSGNGPYYTGQVTVQGSDPYGLDRDGNGVGCD